MLISLDMGDISPTDAKDGYRVATKKQEEEEDVQHTHYCIHRGALSRYSPRLRDALHTYIYLYW